MQRTRKRRRGDLPNLRYITLHGTGRKYVRIPIRCVDATSPKSFFRTRRHVAAGIEGECATCANAEGALDVLGGDGWVFTDTRAIQLKVNKRGELKWGTIFAHAQGPFQKKFDRLGKEVMLDSPECEGVVHLNVPPKRRPSGPSGLSTGGQKRSRDFSRRGPLARLERRGVKLPEGL